MNRSVDRKMNFERLKKKKNKVMKTCTTMEYDSITFYDVITTYFNIALDVSRGLSSNI